MSLQQAMLRLEYAMLDAIETLRPDSLEDELALRAQSVALLGTLICAKSKCATQAEATARECGELLAHAVRDQYGEWHRAHAD